MEQAVALGNDALIEKLEFEDSLEGKLAVSKESVFVQQKSDYVKNPYEQWLDEMDE